MTKIFKSLFLSGILLSSVSGYSNQLSIVSGSGIPASSTSAISINGATVTVQEDLELNTDITVGELRDGLAYSTSKISITKPSEETVKEYSAGDVIVASNFKYASCQDGVWTELYGDSPSQIVPMSSSTYVTNADKIYAYDDTCFDTPLFESDDSGETWHVSDDSTKTVKLVNIDGTEYALSGNDVLYSGNVAVKDSGVWKLLPGFSPNLSKAILTVNDGITLTLGNQQEQATDEDGHPVYEADGATPKMVNKEASTLTVTELGEVYGNVDLQNTETATYANKAVFKKGSKAGEQEAKVTISNGIVDLSDHLSVASNGTPTFTPNSSLNLNSEFSEVQMFPSSNVDTDDTNAIVDAASMANFIDKFNSNTTQLFPNVTGNIHIKYVPYLCMVHATGESSVPYHKTQINTSFLDGISKDTTLSFKSVGLDKIKSHFASDAKVSFTGVNVQTVANSFIQGLKTLNNGTTGSGDLTLTLDVYSLQQVYGDSAEEGITVSSLEPGYDGADKKFKIVLKTTNEQSEETPTQPVETVTPEAELDVNTGIATTTIGSGDPSSPEVKNYNLPEPPTGANTIEYAAENIGTEEQPAKVTMPTETSENASVEKTLDMKNAHVNLECSTDPENPSKLGVLTLDNCNSTISGAIQVDRLESKNSNTKVLGNFTIGKKATQQDEVVIPEEGE